MSRISIQQKKVGRMEGLRNTHPDKTKSNWATDFMYYMALAVLSLTALEVILGGFEMGNQIGHLITSLK